MKQIYLKRLNNLARILREAALIEKTREEFRGFDMSRWGYSARPGQTCGTPACALGHYADRRDVQRRFSLTKQGEVKTHGKGARSGGLIDRAGDHFGITSEQAHAMFGGGDDPGDNKAKMPNGAAYYVERLIKRLQKAA